MGFDLTYKETLTQEEEETLHVEVGRLLNEGRLSEANRVIQTFGYEDRDFNIVTVGY